VQSINDIIKNSYELFYFCYKTVTIEIVATCKVLLPYPYLTFGVDVARRHTIQRQGGPIALPR